jgi:dihydrofolate reductase
MRLSLIVAFDDNQAIGKDNELLWHIPADMKRFKKITTNAGVVIMGRKTYNSIGKPLKGRCNIVITRDRKLLRAWGQELPKELYYVDSVEAAIKTAKCYRPKEAIVIGGAAIYKAFMPMCSKAYITQVEGEFEGDVFFPEFSIKDWVPEEFERFPANKDNPYPYSFSVLARKEHRPSLWENVAKVVIGEEP